MIERITNDSFANNVDKFIVKKIDLKNTYVANNIEGKRVTCGYCRDLNHEAKMEDITNKYNPWWCKTGLVVSTTEEITRLYSALFNDQLVSKKSFEAMTKAIPIMQSGGEHFKKPSYGFGLMIDPESSFGCSYGHGGDGPGFNTWSVYYPEFNNKAVGVTVFCNTSMGGHSLFLVQEILEHLNKM